MNDQIKKSAELLFLALLTIFIAWFCINFWNQTWKAIQIFIESSFSFFNINYDTLLIPLKRKLLNYI